MADTSNYEEVRTNAKIFYRNIKSVHCPALSAHVSFSAKGFNHLIHKGDGTKRDKTIQILRFKLLPKALRLVKLTTTYQEYEETIHKVDATWLKKQREQPVNVKFWGLIAIIDDWKIKVVVRQVGNGGQKHFWSIIPGWVTSYHRDMKLIATVRGEPPTN